MIEADESEFCYNEGMSLVLLQSRLIRRPSQGDYDEFVAAARKRAS